MYIFNQILIHQIFFDYNIRYPSYTPILLHAIDLWYHDPQVTTPVLKLFAELVQNRSQRLQFDVSSPNGILLFREASKVICSYGEFWPFYLFEKILLTLQKKKSNNFCTDNGKVVNNLYFVNSEKIVQK